MAKVNKAWVMVAGLLLVGCAATPKPEMTEQMLQGSAANWVVIQKCGTQGDMSPELTAEGIRIFNVKLSGYAYNQSSLNQHIQDLATKYPQVSKEDCNKMAVSIAGVSQQWARNNKEADALIAENQRAMGSNTAINTYCNKIGSQTFCRSQ